jgi:hypothetical protein
MQAGIHNGACRSIRTPNLRCKSLKFPIFRCLKATVILHQHILSYKHGGTAIMDKERLTETLCVKTGRPRLDRIDQTAARFGTDRSDIARRALDIGLRRFANATPPPGSPGGDENQDE